MKDFRILQTCSICGQGFDSDYRLMKHIGASHPQSERTGWAGEEEHSCGCDGEHAHSDMGQNS